MNKTNKAPIPYSFWAAIVGFSLSIINDFGDYIPFLKEIGRASCRERVFRAV